MAPYRDFAGEVLCAADSRLGPTHALENDTSPAR
jgi:hypothetical protein